MTLMQRLKPFIFVFICVFFTMCVMHLYALDSSPIRLFLGLTWVILLAAEIIQLLTYGSD